jgi:hypothetical protein
MLVVKRHRAKVEQILCTARQNRNCFWFGFEKDMMCLWRNYKATSSMGTTYARHMLAWMPVVKATQVLNSTCKHRYIITSSANLPTIPVPQP